jgi:hypothetical protein
MILADMLDLGLFARSHSLFFYLAPIGPYSGLYLGPLALALALALTWFWFWLISIRIGLIPCFFFLLLL